MKTIIAITVVAMTLVVGLCFMADNPDTVEIIETQQTIGVMTNGKPGMHINDNLCMDLTTGVTKVCF